MTAQCFRARVVSGRGRAALDLEAHLEELRGRTGDALIAGTLNLCGRRPLILRPETALRFDHGLRMLWPGRLDGKQVWIYRWRNARLHVVEVLADRSLRNLFSLRDGDTVDITISVGDIHRISLGTRLCWYLAWSGRTHWYYRNDAYQKRLRKWERMLGVLQPALPAADDASEATGSWTEGGQS